MPDSLSHQVEGHMRIKHESHPSFHALYGLAPLTASTIHDALPNKQSIPLF